jgi:hypothetical protein
MVAVYADTSEDTPALKSGVCSEMWLRVFRHPIIGTDPSVRLLRQDQRRPAHAVELPLDVDANRGGELRAEIPVVANGIHLSHHELAGQGALEDIHAQ